MVISSYHQRRCCLKIINLGSKPTTSISRGSEVSPKYQMKSRYNKPFCLNLDSFLRDPFFFGFFWAYSGHFCRSKTKNPGIAREVGMRLVFLLILTARKMWLMLPISVSLFRQLAVVKGSLQPQNQTDQTNHLFLQIIPGKNCCENFA